MVNPTPVGMQMPWSLKSLRMGGSSNRSNQDVINQMGEASRDFYDFKDNFNHETVANDAFWTAAATGAGSASPVYAVLTGCGDSVAFVTGGGNPGVSVLYGKNLICYSDQNPFFWARIKWPAAVTNFAFECGFANVLSTKTTQANTGLAAVSSGTTATTLGNGFTDGVIISRDSAFTLTTAALIGVGTSTTAVGIPIYTGPGSATGYTPTAAKWTDIYVGARVGQGYCEIYENDVFIGQYSVASGPDTAVAMFPYFQFTDHGTSKTVSMSGFRLIKERNDR